ncbi:MAG: helix-hairpin-helix domain-containing protein [Dehalococcoidales bacterium]|nr:helix-hairpin-helix domain-containing protein [Dehalococcoidales bacterium]
MPDVKPAPQSRWGIFAILVLLVILGITSGIILSRYQPPRPLEITLPSDNPVSGFVTISGSVTSPGIYPFQSDDSVDSLLAAAGGVVGAQPDSLKLTVISQGLGASPQKVNINTADAWLLEALPGIGATRAQAIVVYRETNGPFKTTADIMKIAGFSQKLYDEVKELITVTD